MELKEALYTTRAMRRVRTEPMPEDGQARSLDAGLNSEVSIALGFVTRDEVNEAIRLITDGREQVDPSAEG